MSLFDQNKNPARAAVSSSSSSLSWLRADFSLELHPQQLNKLKWARRLGPHQRRTRADHENQRNLNLTSWRQIFAYLAQFPLNETNRNKQQLERLFSFWYLLGQVSAFLMCWIFIYLSVQFIQLTQLIFHLMVIKRNLKKSAEDHLLTSPARNLPTFNCLQKSIFKQALG